MIVSSKMERRDLRLKLLVGFGENRGERGGFQTASFLETGNLDGLKD